MAVFAIVLAGGAGTRFWPASRAARPKQLLALVGHESLLAATVARVAPVVPAERVVVATGAHLLDATRAALPHVPAENFLAEPVPRNTAPAIAWATHAIAARDPDAICMVLPSDHFIAKPAEFLAAASRAIDAARAGHLVTLGIRPTRPDTGFGYVEPAGAATEGPWTKVKSFVEKPSREGAEVFIERGYLWNAGMFFFAARTMQAALARYLPDVAELAPQGAASFASMKSISIDYGVMQDAARDGRVVTVAGDFGWSDLGSWQSAWELAARDENDNVLPDGSVAIDARGNLVWERAASGRTYALVGVNDLVVVETEDAVLIVPRDRAQDVKLVVDKLKSIGSRKI